MLNRLRSLVRQIRPNAGVVTPVDGDVPESAQSSLDMISVADAARWAGIVVFSFLLMFLTSDTGPAITDDDLDGMFGFLLGFGGLAGYRALRAGQVARRTVFIVVGVYVLAVTLRYLFL